MLPQVLRKLPVLLRLEVDVWAAAGSATLKVCTSLKNLYAEPGGALCSLEVAAQHSLRFERHVGPCCGTHMPGAPERWNHFQEEAWTGHTPADIKG